MVAVTPLVTVASNQVEMIKAAKSLGIATAVCIASWDNLTNKGLIRVQPDRVFLWNHNQQSEAIKYHYIPQENIVMTGAPVFDPCFDYQPGISKEAFCEKLGLNPDLPIITFLGSSSFISNHQKEVKFERTQTLAESGKPCDFRFSWKTEEIK